MRRYVLSEDEIIEDSQIVTSIHPLFDAVDDLAYFINVFSSKHRNVVFQGLESISKIVVHFAMTEH